MAEQELEWCLGAPPLEDATSSRMRRRHTRPRRTRGSSEEHSKNEGKITCSCCSFELQQNKRNVHTLAAKFQANEEEVRWERAKQPQLINVHMTRVGPLQTTRNSPEVLEELRSSTRHIYSKSDNEQEPISSHTNATTTTLTSTGNSCSPNPGARSKGEWFWSRWPHEVSGSSQEDPEGWRLSTRRKLSSITKSSNSAPSNSMMQGIVIILVVAYLCPSPAKWLNKSSQASNAVSAYQLTNNMIANNLPPKFVQSLGIGSSTTTNSEIVVRVKEGPQSIGKLIYTLKGDDPDEDPLTFGVLGTMASDLLRIENVPGNQANVYLRKELDRETTESHQVIITLTDGKLGRGNWITKSMLIIVEDVNDNYPVFGPHRTAISIREDAKAPLLIETIEATDADEGRFGQVIYKLDESNSLSNAPGHDLPGSGGATPSSSQSLGDIFQIETIDGKGVISLVGQLDFEQRPLYQLRILAIDRAHENERLSTSTSILVGVEDCEDQPPMFTFAPSITRIPEDLPVGSQVLRVSAIDGDRGVNNPIKYSLVSVNGQESGFERNMFSIGSDSGQISVAHELDRELSLNSAGQSSNARPTNQPGAYVLQVRASEVASSSGLLDSLLGPSSNSAATSVTTELTVILIDVNDELPTFSQAKFYGELLENSPAESLVTFVQTAGPGSITLANSREVATAKVVDRDQGTNGTFTLHLEGEHGHLFEVWPSEATNEANLMIKVSSAALQQPQNAKYFDYEKTKELRLAIVAREKFPPPNSSDSLRESRAEMSIQVRDANDNYPQFDSDLYRVEIPENAIRGMHICAVKAWDPDSGPLGTVGVRYTEIRGERANMFKLDPMTGVITLKTNEHGFDRETIPQHHLIVEARDNSGLGNRNTTQLLIVLTDVNDQRPKFLLDQYEAFIYENELDFQSPLQVQAQDQDAPHTQNSRVTYSIVGGDPQQNFTIDPLTGRIRVRTTLVAAPSAVAPSLRQDAGFDPPTGNPDQAQNFVQVAGLDFERIAQKRDDTRQFNLTVKATDGGLPEALAATTQVIVFVYDKNDHAPVFSRPVYSKSLREDAPGGSPVLQVQAHDGDHSPTNSRISYRIASGGSDKFVIDSDSGLISIANGANLDIDRVQGGGQRRTSYLLNVLASDGSFGQNQKSSSCLVNISIIDVNNKAPEFVSLGANVGPGSSVVQARSTPLTSEALPNGVVAAQVANGPPANQQWVLVNEDAPYGLIVTRVFATDLDSTAELRYSINYARSEARNEDMLLVEPQLYRDVFTIEPTDGTIKVSKQLDRELFDQVKLRLQVEDLAAQTPDQVAHAHLLIRITDVNDNRPTFKRPIYKAVVNENSIGGTSVATITADDRDLNKTLRYSLEAQSAEQARLVRINPRSGEVTVNDKIDRELFPLINVTVRAEDFGQPHSLTGSAQLIITVRDENDNNPIFLNSTHLGPAISGSSQRDGAVGGSPSNHNMNYLPSGSAASSYRLRSLGPPGPGPGSSRFLNEDQPPILDLTEDQSAGHHLLAPSDEQGRELTLLAPGATAQVREDAPVGRQIAYVRAEDADMGNNGRVTYLLDANSSGGGKFRLDRDSGILSVAQPLDREQQRHFTLIIEACDNFDLGYSTGESRRAFTQVNIRVTDINDNAPLISTNLQSTNQVGHTSQVSPSVSLQYPSHEEAINSQGPYEMPLAECLHINEFQPLNEPILTITATDLDDPETPNGQVDLAIINNLPQQEMFSLVPVRPSGSLSSSSAASSLGNEPVTLTTTTGRSVTSPDLPASQPPSSSDMNIGFGDQLEPELSALRRSRRSSNDAFPSQLEPGNSYRSSSMVAASRTRPASSGQVATTETPLTSSVTVTTLSRSSAYPLQNRISGSQQQQAIIQTMAGVEQQWHVVVSQSLKERVGNYSILVRATDRGLPSLTSAKLINICVQDVNNHAPVFIRPPLNHTIRIMENATVGSYVTQVEATDLDHGLNGELQYSLKPTGNIQSSSNDWQSFKIDRLSGVISTTKLFNRQIKKYYSLRVEAQDFGRPTSLSSDIDINIMIVNLGKYQPEFEHQQQHLQFTENVAPGTEWFKLPQTINLDDDPALINAPFDESANTQKSPANPVAGGKGNWLSSPCYYIVDGDDNEQVFHLDRYTHKLTNQKELDREKKANYTLIVQASNNCNSKPVVASMRLVSSNEVAASPGGSSVGTGERTQSLQPRVRRQAPASAAQPSPPPTPTPRTGKRIYEDQPTNSNSEKASPHELQLSPNWDRILADDKSLLKISIRIKDINDNAPKFTQRIYTGGITTEADFGTVFMIVQALDGDADANGQVTYSIVKPIKSNLGLQGAPVEPQTSPASARQKHLSLQPDADESSAPTKPRYAPTSEPTEDEPSPSRELQQSQPTNELGPQLADGDDLFVVGPQTGEISLNFDPQKHMKGYFEFEIQAKDPDGLSDSARVLIYLLRQDQRVKFVLRLTPQELRQRLNKFRSVFGNITGAIVNIDSYKYFENHDGTVDKKKTSLFLHFVQPEDNTIIEVDKVLTLIDNNIEYLDELYKEFHVLSSEAAHLPLSGSGALVDPIDQVRTGLMGISSFLALILVLVIALCLNQRTRYERQLKAATVTAFGTGPLHLDPDFHSTTNLPNTNLHSQDPNPIWINGHHYSTGNGRDLVGHWQANESLNLDTKSKKPDSRHRPPAAASKETSPKEAKQQQLFHSASSGLGLTLDDEEEMGELDDQLSSSNGDQSSDLNSLHHHHHHLNQYNVASAATATPRDSLTSSHGQVSSSSAASSGANSASTTNERQVLCSSAQAKQQKSSSGAASAQSAGDRPATQNQTTKLKLNATSKPTNSMQSGGANSTFGHGNGGTNAFKEVTIYTEHQQRPSVPTSGQQNKRQAAPPKPMNQQQQHQTSHVNRLASQFNASRLQLNSADQQHQQHNKSTVYAVTASQQNKRQPQAQQQQQRHILVHSNGADVNQGIIKTTGIQNATSKQFASNQLDAKFVPASPSQQEGRLSQNVTTQQQQQQEQNVNNFETSLSKLSILNLETTEL